MRRIAAVTTLLGLLSCDSNASTSALIGTEGGEIQWGDLTLIVPAGALPSATMLTVSTTGDPSGLTGARRVGNTITIEPSGTIFSPPAQLTLRYQGNDHAVRLYTANQSDEPFLPLVSTVDSEGRTVSASIDHLSVFVPAVLGETSNDLCQEGRTCDCSSTYDAHALESTRAELGQLVRAICYVGDGKIQVLGQSGDSYTVSTLDAVSLALEAQEPTDTPSLEGGAPCAPAPAPRFARGGVDGTSWHANIEKDLWDEWYHETLILNGGLYRMSFNDYLNSPTPVDVESLPAAFHEDSTALAFRLRDDGGIRFYLHVWHDMHIDALELLHFSAALANPSLDENGFVEASWRTRVELATGLHNHGGTFPSILAVADPDEPANDIVTVINPGSVPRIRAYRVTQTLMFEELPAIEEDSFWGQLGWTSGGLDQDGILWVRSNAASFSNSYLMALDPGRFQVIGIWEIGCFGTPAIGGFVALPNREGVAVSFSTFDQEDGSVIERVTFLEHGQIVGMANAAFESDPSQWILVDALDRLIVANAQTGELTSIAVPR